MDWKPFVILFLLRPAMLADDRPVNAWRMGWEALLVQPTGSLNAFSGALSPGLGVLAERRVGESSGIQTALSYVKYNNSHLPGLPEDGQSWTRLQSVGCMVNFVHRLPLAPRRRPFLLAGVGVRNLWGSTGFPADTAPAGLGGNPVLGEQRISYGTGLKVACQVGIGCELDPAWRVSARCQVSRSMGHTLPTVELGIGRRF